MDLTPPEEWDESPNPELNFLQVIQNLNRQIRQSFQWEWLPALLPKPERLEVSQFAEIKTAINNFMQAASPVVEVANKLSKIEEEKHGTHIYVPYKKNLGLPPKKTNTGPVSNPFAKRGRR